MNSGKTTLRTLRNIEWRIVKAEKNKINQVLPYKSTNNIIYLDPKRPKQRNRQNNYRPITCLHRM